LPDKSSQQHWEGFSGLYHLNSLESSNLDSDLTILDHDL
jgi:hypothetical protein